MSLLLLSLLLVAGLLWWLAMHLQRRSGLPRARLRYDDASAGRRPERALLSHRHRLTGRPDYLLEEGGSLIPVELKPTRRAATPYESDILQLAAYCLLVEEKQGHAPPYGILRYAEQGWEIPYTPALRQRLLETLAQMARAEQAREVARSHHQPPRCAACSQQAHCTQRLA